MAFTISKCIQLILSREHSRIKTILSDQRRAEKPFAGGEGSSANANIPFHFKSATSRFHAMKYNATALSTL